MVGLKTFLASALAVPTIVLRNRKLRRVQLAWVLAVLSEWGFAVAVSVYAYQRDGATAVGIVAFVRLLAPALTLPFLTALADRRRRTRVMAASALSAALLLTLCAAFVYSDAAAIGVYVLQALAMVAGTLFRPAQAALLPSLATSPEELTAANGMSSAIEAVAIFAGPLLTGGVLALFGVGAALAVAAGGYALALVFVLGVHEGAREEVPMRGVRDVAAELVAGVTTVARAPRLRFLIGLIACQALLAGALGVFVVVLALGRLGLGDGGVGLLYAAPGVGGLIGALAAVGLVGRRGLAAGVALGLVLWGAPIALIGIWPTTATALVLLGLVGLGNAFVDVSAFTLIQRTVPDEVLARVFGVLGSVVLGCVACGALLAPALVGVLGIRGALVVSGSFLLVVTALGWRRLRAIDRAADLPQRQLELLRATPLFAPLAAPTLEALAQKLVPLSYAAGAEVVREGDQASASSSSPPASSQSAPTAVKALFSGPGDFFGEIALLRNVPRMATVRAVGNVELYALGREDFISAVTGHPESAAAAAAVVATRLASLRPAAASL